MNTPMLTDEITTMFDSELIGFLARRYNKSVPEIIRQFLIQNDNENSVSSPAGQQGTGFILESNEMEILRGYYNR